MFTFLSSVLVALAAGGAVHVGLRRRTLPRAFRSNTWVWVLAGASAFLAIPSAASPTGNLILDAVYRALLAAGVTVAASKARRWAWLVAAGAVVVADHGSVVGLPAGAALGVALGSGWVSRPGRVVGALIGVAVSQGVLRMRWAHPLGASAAVTLVVVGVLGVSYLNRSRRTARRRILAGGGILLGIGALAVAIYGVAAWSVRTDARTGLDEAQTALAAARAGQLSVSSAHLQAALAALEEVRRKTDAWWDRPVLAVPAVAQNVAAVRVVTAQAGAVLDQVDGLLQTAGLGHLHVEDGTVDLGRIDRLGPQVSSSRRTLEVADAAIARLHSPWLVEPLVRRLDQLRSKLSQSISAESTLAVATQELPEMLGANGPRRWLLVVLDNSELRGGGGLVADVGEIAATSGHVALTSLQPATNLVDPSSRATVRGEAEYMARYGFLDPAGYFIDDAHSPDFPTDADILAQLYPDLGGEPVSGVIGVDAFGLAALLQVTGPVSLPVWPVPITSANAATILLHDQYLTLSGTPRTQFLVDLGHSVFKHLTTGSLPDPGALAPVLGPAAAGHHIQLYSNVPAEERLFDRLGASGRMPTTTSDFLEVADHNFSQDKGDWFLTRSIKYSVNYNVSNGAETATLEVELHNAAPTSGEPAYILGGAVTAPGYDEQWVCVYTPLALADASRDGRSLSMSREREAGRNVYCGFTDVPPGGSSTFLLHLHGLFPEHGSYHLIVGYQPAPHPDALSFTLRDSQHRTRQWQFDQTRPVSIKP